MRGRPVSCDGVPLGEDSEGTARDTSTYAFGRKLSMPSLGSASNASGSFTEAAAVELSDTMVIVIAAVAFVCCLGVAGCCMLRRRISARAVFPRPPTDRDSPDKLPRRSRRSDGSIRYLAGDVIAQGGGTPSPVIGCEVSPAACASADLLVLSAIHGSDKEAQAIQPSDDEADIVLEDMPDTVPDMPSVMTMMQPPRSSVLALADVILAHDKRGGMWACTRQLNDDEHPLATGLDGNAVDGGASAANDAVDVMRSEDANHNEVDDDGMCNGPLAAANDNDTVEHSPVRRVRCRSEQDRSLDQQSQDMQVVDLQNLHDDSDGK